MTSSQLTVENIRDLDDALTSVGKLVHDIGPGWYSGSRDLMTAYRALNNLYVLVTGHPQL